MQLCKLKKDDLFTFLISKTSKKIKEFICTTWEITNYLSEVKRFRKGRLEILKLLSKWLCTELQPHLVLQCTGNSTAK